MIPPPEWIPARDMENLGPIELAKSLQRLAKERSFLNTVFQTLQEGILVLDEEGIITYANASGCALLSIQKEDIGMQSLRKISPEIAKIIQPLQPSATPSAWKRQEVEISYPQRKILRICMSFFAQTDDLREKPYWVVILNDITQDKAQAEASFEAEQLQSLHLLAGSVAHEIGNPLNSLAIHLQLLEKRISSLDATAPTASLKESVHICQQEVDRLDGIVKHFLKAIRPITPHFEEVDVLKILAEVVFFQKSEMENLAIEVDMNVKETIPPLKADPNLLKQVFFNVIKNALEAMDGGGKLSIEAELDDTYAVLRFQDNGVGIEASSISQLFQPFYTTKHNGNGLGLIMVERIIRAHGGQVILQSTPQQGTTVTLQLPHSQKRVRLLSEGVI
jgi:two-component system, sporulation sensor kinase E